MAPDPKGHRERLPSEADIDVFGLTHTGKARPNNADHFLILSMNRSLQVRGTSLPEGLFRPLATQPTRPSRKPRAFRVPRAARDGFGAVVVGATGSGRSDVVIAPPPFHLAR